MEDSLIGRSWKLSQLADFKRCLIFHHHINHWLVFEKTYQEIKEDLLCYEPFKSHGRRFDVHKLALFAQFFNPLRGDHMV